MLWPVLTLVALIWFLCGYGALSLITRVNKQTAWDACQIVAHGPVGLAATLLIALRD